ncbi:MAG: hypothetical protein ACYS8X_01145 [Planctomycetota bacterium]
MKNYAAAILMALLLVSCRGRTSVPATVSVAYEYYDEGNSAWVRTPVDSPLAEEIATEVAGQPDVAEKGVGMGLDPRKYVHVSGRGRFLVVGNQLIVIDRWGTRTWIVSEIQQRLDALRETVPDERSDSDSE